MGLGTALAAQRRRIADEIVVLEKEPDVARHQSGNNSGVLHCGLYYQPGSLKAPSDWAGDWGYAADESLDTAGLVAERFRGIRPAPGYPACPDHTVKRDLFRALGCDEIGMQLTESMAMLPAASVAGFYFAHPESTYFNVGKIGRDQLKNWAERSAISAQDAERALTPLL